MAKPDLKHGRFLAGGDRLTRGDHASFGRCGSWGRYWRRAECPVPQRAIGRLRLCVGPRRLTSRRMAHLAGLAGRHPPVIGIWRMAYERP